MALNMFADECSLKARRGGKGRGQELMSDEDVRVKRWV
jgi:hypothetical protein